VSIFIGPHGLVIGSEFSFFGIFGELEFAADYQEHSQ
jgi:hypothetical protein